jgi:hypothetical protein
MRVARGGVGVGVEIGKIKKLSGFQIFSMNTGDGKMRI